MVHLYKKVEFIALVMEQLGFAAKNVTRAEDPERIVYWLKGITGFYNHAEAKHMSFAQAQTLASHLIWAMSNQPTRFYISPEIKYNFWNHDIILTYSKIARIVTLAASATSTDMLVGGFKGVVYCNRKKLVKDEANGIVLSTARKY